MTSSVGGGRISPVSESGKMELLRKEVDYLRIRLEHRIGGVRLSKVAETYCTYFDQWVEYDPFITPSEPSNPWINDSTDFWESERQTLVVVQHSSLSSSLTDVSCFFQQRCAMQKSKKMGIFAQRITS